MPLLLRHAFTDSGIVQGERRDSKTFAVVDEDYGIPGSLVENHQACNGVGPLAQSDPRSLFLSMSEYDKPPYHDVYGKFNSIHQYLFVPHGCLTAEPATSAGSDSVDEKDM